MGSQESTYRRRSVAIGYNSLIAAIQLIAPTNKLLKYTDMKWIKGKPKAEDIDKVIMRRISNRLFVITQVYEYDSVQLDTSVETVLWEDIEWLDESAPISEGEGWNDGMPLYDGDYLCSVIEIEDCGEKYTRLKVIECFFNNWVVKANQTVTHWQPLPSPPKQ